MRSARQRRPSPDSLAAAARRLSILLCGTVGATALVSLLLGLASGVSLQRAISLGFYVVGSFLLVGGFFIGNRGPVRLRDSTDAAPVGPRRVRWATAEERVQAMNDSAIFIAVGLALIVLGLVVDARVRVI
jgi:hypothetical protein